MGKRRMSNSIRPTWGESALVGASSLVTSLVGIILFATPPAAFANRGFVPVPPVLDPPPGSNGPEWFYVDESDCDIELEFTADDVPPPIERQNRVWCGLTSSGARYGVYGIYLETLNGYHVEGEGSIRNYCSGVLQDDAYLADGLVATLTTVGIPGSAPPPGIAHVESDPEATVVAFTEGMATGEVQVWHDVHSSATNCDRVIDTGARSSFLLGPTANGSGGFSVGAMGFSFGFIAGGSATIVSGEGTQRSHIIVSKLEDRQPTMQESTRVWCAQQIKLWARGSSTLPCGSYAAAFVERWDPATQTRLECGGDADGDGDEDTILIVEW